MIYPSDRPLRTGLPLEGAQRWMASDEDARQALVKVFVAQQAYRQFWEHANSDLEHEVGGWLVGRWCWDEALFEEFVLVEAVLPASEVEHSSTHLTFTKNSQLAMLEELEKKHPERGVVGWYHTHPRMGLFLSGYDLWLHSHFFPYPWQVALVMDPHSRAGGFFVRNRDLELDPGKYCGFYELCEDGKEPAVSWENLQLENEVNEEDVDKQSEEKQSQKKSPKEEVKP